MFEEYDKIFVVVISLLIIFILIVVQLFLLEKKIKKLEKVKSSTSKND